MEVRQQTFFIGILTGRPLGFFGLNIGGQVGVGFVQGTTYVLGRGKQRSGFPMHNPHNRPARIAGSQNMLVL